MQITVSESDMLKDSINVIAIVMLVIMMMTRHLNKYDLKVKVKVIQSCPTL